MWIFAYFIFKRTGR